MTAPVEPAPTAPRKTKGVLIGILLMVASVVVGLGMVIAGFVQLAHALEARPRMIVPGTQTFTLDAGDYVLYGSDSRTTAAQVTITAPDGSSPRLGDVRGLQTANVGSKSFVGFATFRAPTTGPYVVKVEQSPRPMDRAAELMIGEDAFTLVGITLGLVFGGIALGGILFIAGLVVMIVSLVRRSRANRPPMPPMPPMPPSGYAYPPGPPPGYGAPPGPSGYGAPPPGPPR